jgi:hypothetical protein
MKANFAAKIAIATPIVTTILAIMVGLSAHPGIVLCIASAMGGFAIGAFFGALSGGIANILLSRAVRCSNQFCVVGIAVIYIILPLVFLAVACVATSYGLRIIL